MVEYRDLLNYAIITDGEPINRIGICIESLIRQGARSDQIIVVTDHFRTVRRSGISQICPEGEQKYEPPTITRKKNVAVSQSMGKYTVLMHDYFEFLPDWIIRMSSNILTHSPDVICCQNQLINGNRHFTDWVNWDHPHIPKYSALPYDQWTLTRYQYISGGFFVVKTDFAKENPFDEKLNWGQSEDVEWSLRIRDKAKITCEGTAIVRHTKYHRDFTGS